jgi:hypothetical protein
MTTIAGGRECELGIDISVYQPTVNWVQVASCRKFAWLKASGSDGGNYTDHFFGVHRANSAGRLMRAAYHFMGMGSAVRPEAQADYFVNVTNGYSGFEMPAVIDFETYGNVGQYAPSADDLTRFIRELHQLVTQRWAGPTGEQVACVVYTGSAMSNRIPAGVQVFDLVLAAYLNRYYGNPWPGITNGVSPAVSQLGNPDHYIPHPWRTWGAWQFAGGDGGCPGVGNGTSNCDQDAMTTEAFYRLTNHVGEDVGLTDADKAWLQGLHQETAGWLQQQAERVMADLTPKIEAAGRTSRPFRFMKDVNQGGDGSQWVGGFSEDGAFRMHVPGEGDAAPLQFALISAGMVDQPLAVMQAKEFDVLCAHVREVLWNPNLVKE